MSQPFVAEIKIFAGNFAPRGWALCDGQLLSLSQNTALYSIIGTTYGGDGRTTMGLPDLKGRAPMHPGRGPGLSARTLGQKTGVETVTVAATQMASHTHNMQAVPASQFTPGGDSLTPVGNNLSAPQTGNAFVGATNLTAMAANAVAATGGNQAHNNLQPFLTMYFIIALVGLYPSRG